MLGCRPAASAVVDLGVYAADEERRNAVDRGDVTTACCQGLKPLQIRIDHLLVPG